MTDETLPIVDGTMPSWSFTGWARDDGQFVVLGSRCVLTAEVVSGIAEGAELRAEPWFIYRTPDRALPRKIVLTLTKPRNDAEPMIIIAVGTTWASALNAVTEKWADARPFTAGPPSA